MINKISMLSLSTLPTFRSLLLRMSGKYTLCPSDDTKKKTEFLIGQKLQIFW